MANTTWAPPPFGIDPSETNFSRNCSLQGQFAVQLYQSDGSLDTLGIELTQAFIRSALPENITIPSGGDLLQWVANNVQIFQIYPHYNVSGLNVSEWNSTIVAEENSTLVILPALQCFSNFCRDYGWTGNSELAGIGVSHHLAKEWE